MSPDGLTKRAFLQAIGVSLPVVKLALSAAGAPPQAASASARKFTTIDCGRYFNAAPADLGRGEQAAQEALRHTPSGSQRCRGIPFVLGPGGESPSKRWIALCGSGRSWTATRTEIPAGRTATYLCLAQFCDWDANENPQPGSSAFEKAGQELARLTLIYEGGGEHIHAIRRRFEVNSLTVPWGHLCFAAVPHRMDVARSLTDPLPKVLD